MPRNYSSAQTISLHGKAVGIQHMSSGQTGSTLGRHTFLTGFDEIRIGVSTAETTSVNLHAFGVSLLTTGTSRVFTLNPPIPGVSKTIMSTCASGAYVKTRNGETLESTKGTTHNTVLLTSFSFIKLMGITTARWLVTNSPLTSASVTFTTST